MKFWKKCIKVVVLMSYSILLLNLHTVSAATENDLREVMGYIRLDDGTGEKEAKAIISGYTQDEMYNHILSRMKEQETSQEEQGTSNGSEIENALGQCYTYLMELVSSGASIEAVMETFSQYDTLCMAAVPDTQVSTVDLELIELEKIQEDKEKAEAILLAAGSTDDIGEVGVEMETFLGRTLRIADVGSNSIAVYTEIDEVVSSQLTGEVKDITSDSVTVKSGGTIYLTFTGIKPTVECGDMVQQGDKLGTAIGNEVTLSMEMVLEKVNPLLMYGSRAVAWYERYLEENPWNGRSLDMTGMKDAPGTSEDEKENDAGTMTDADSQVHNLYIEGMQETEEE